MLCPSKEARMGTIRRNRLIWWALVLGLLVTACAEAGGASGVGGSQGGASSGAGAHDTGTVEVDLQDRGKTITLEVGDRLAISLPDSPESPWVLILYPKHILTRVSGEAGRSAYVFAARAAGTGRIVLFNRSRCGPVPESLRRPPCPVGDVDAPLDLIRPLGGAFFLAVRVK